MAPWIIKSSNNSTPSRDLPLLKIDGRHSPMKTRPQVDNLVNRVRVGQVRFFLWIPGTSARKSSEGSPFRLIVPRQSLWPARVDEIKEKKADAIT